jgi:hypothetical protein
MSDGVEVFEKNHLLKLQNHETLPRMRTQSAPQSMFLLKLLAAALVLAIIAPAVVLAA